MSIQGLSWAAEVDTLRGLAKFVLMALANYADDDGVCWPSQRSLAEFTGQSERSVRRHLAMLEELGYIYRQSRKKTRGARTSDIFTLNWGVWPRASRAAANPRGDRPVGGTQQAVAKIAQHSADQLGQPGRDSTGQSGRSDKDSTGQSGQKHRPNCPEAPAKLSGAKNEPSLNHQLKKEARARPGGGTAAGARRPQGAAPAADRGNGATEGSAEKSGPFPRKDPPLWQRLIADWVISRPKDYWTGHWTDDNLRRTFRDVTSARPSGTAVLQFQLLAKEAGVVSELPDDLIVGLLDAKDHRTGTWLVSDEVLARRGLTRPESPP